jgi:hypothetical protein
MHATFPGLISLTNIIRCDIYSDTEILYPLEFRRDVFEPAHVEMFKSRSALIGAFNIICRRHLAPIGN